MVQERQLPVTEIKAGLKLAKKFYEIELDDTDYIKGIKSLLKDISSALETNDFNKMLHCNHLAAENYGDVLVKDRKRGFRRINIKEIAKFGVGPNAFLLWLIGESLIEEIRACKAKEKGKAFVDVAGEYVCDKIVDSVTTH